MTIPKISLVVSDIDGTLITPQKEITPAAKQAVHDLRARGIKFAVASSRPARGLKFITDELTLDTPVSGFNGGRVLSSEGEVMETMRLPNGSAGQLVDIMDDMGISVWLFAGDDWYITDPAGPRVDHETRSIRYDPIVVPKFDNSMLDDAVKLVGVNMDFDLVKRGEDAINAALGAEVSATRSQPFYLDVTHIDANKGEVVKRLSRHYGIPQAEVATIGDGENDILMFRQSGYSFAMGNGSDKVKAEAKDVTTANSDEGFANAMNRILASLG